MKTWFMHHRKALAAAVRRLAGAPGSTVLGALVIGIALALPGAGELVLVNLDSVNRQISAKPQISIFMKVDARKADAAAIQARIKAMPEVATFRFVPREDALRRLRENEGLAEVLDSLPNNPFPDAFIIEPGSDSSAELERIRAQMAEWPKVEFAQLDSAWAKRLYAFLRLARAAVAVLAALLGLALVVVTFNTIRLQILTLRAEIEVSRLLGATDGYIRRPFFYYGALQGLLGGAIAWLIVFASGEALRKPVTELASLYDLSFTMRALPWRESVVLLIFAAALGLFGAWLSVARHLREAEVP